MWDSSIRPRRSRSAIVSASSRPSSPMSDSELMSNDRRSTVCVSVVSNSCLRVSSLAWTSRSESRFWRRCWRNSAILDSRVSRMSVTPRSTSGDSDSWTWVRSSCRLLTEWWRSTRLSRRSSSRSRFWRSFQHLKRRSQIVSLRRFSMAAISDLMAGRIPRSKRSSGLMCSSPWTSSGIWSRHSDQAAAFSSQKVCSSTSFER